MWTKYWHARHSNLMSNTCSNLQGWSTTADGPELQATISKLRPGERYALRVKVRAGLSVLASYSCA